ncbi:MAG: hypothetical protein JNL19_07165 [Burkholderiales bacterium]|nr:hypothetical protein [Burkholderiales bacterium]
MLSLTARRARAATVWALVVSTAAAAETDQQVLQQFAQATAMPAPQISQGADGNTQLTWNTTLDLSVYRNTQSGGAMLNPNAGGGFYKFQFGTDYKLVTEGDVTRWAQVQLTQSDDRTVQRFSFFTNKVLLGYSQPGVTVNVGDLALSHSQLSANLPIRGASAQKFLGPLVITGAGGVFGEDWRSVFDRRVRTAYPRESYAMKVGSSPTAFDTAAPLLKGLEIYATVQRFRDLTTTQDQSPLLTTSAAGAQGASATVGASFKRDSVSVAAEFARSRFERSDIGRDRDQAFVSEFSWQGDPVALRFGHQNIGADFATLATLSPGTRESFGNAVWKALPTLSFTLDGRQSRYVPSSRTALIAPAEPPKPTPDPFAPPNPTPTAVKLSGMTASESGSLTANWTPTEPAGFSITATAGRATTRQLDSDSRTRNDNASATVNYSRDGWTATANVTAQRNQSLGSSPGTASTDAATMTLGKTFSDDSNQRSLNTMLAYMKQWQVNGATATQSEARGWNDRWTLTLGLNLTGKGSFNGTAFYGHMKDPVSGAVGKQQGVQAELVWQMNPKWSFKLFGRDNRNWQTLAAQAYSDRSIGVAVVGSF